MYSKAKIGRHPIHPMLVAFPITFYTMTLIAFVVYQFVNRDQFWFQLGYFCNFAGVATAFLAAIPGLIDWALAIPMGTAAKNRGFVHMLLNVATLITFGVSATMIADLWNAPPGNVIGPLLLSVVGVGLTLAAGFHGWLLIARHKVGVELTPEQERLEPIENQNPKNRGVSARPYPITGPR